MSELPPLRDFPLFVSLDDATLRRLAAEAKIETLDDGATIFRQGHPANSMILIVSGFAKLIRTSESGDETVVCIKGERASITDAPTSPSEICHVSAEAVGPTTVLKIAAGKFLRLMTETPALALAALDEAKRSNAELAGELESLKSQSADQRLARFLLTLCPADADCRRFRLPYDKRLIAARLGVTQETLSRAFARLRESGVRTETRDVFVESVARLRAHHQDYARPSLGKPLHPEQAS